MSVPGLSRIALGVWRRLPSADQNLPPLVSLVSTASTILIWASPHHDSGIYGHVLLPGFLRPARSSSTVSITKITARSDDPIVPTPSRYEFGFESTALSYTRHPMRVRVYAERSDGLISLDGMLTTPKGEHGATTGEISYEIRSPDFIGVLTVDRNRAESELSFRYSIELASIPRC